MNLYYEPWVPREGMRGMYRALAAAWGNPNTIGNKWPQATLEAVCEKGKGQAVVFDQHCMPHSPTYFLSPRNV